MPSYFCKSLIIMFFVVITSKVVAQSDCVLGIGITNDSILVDVFQLNTLQLENLADFSAELKYRNEILENTLVNIRKRHPQGTVPELSKLADEYNAVIDSMASVQAMIDKKMLSLFNEKQYTLYRNLCLEASRSPFIVVPTAQTDTILVKKRLPILNKLKDKN